MHRLLATFLIVAASVALSGCSAAQGKLLGMHKGYLLTAYDGLALPGESVDVQVRLEGGQMLKNKPGYVVRFYDRGQLYKACETDDDGYARISVTSRQSGDVILTAGFSPNGFPEGPPPPTGVLVACRLADEPMIVVDLDRTLVSSGAVKVLLGEAKPFPDSPEVMQRIACQYTVLYLTHRPDLFSVRTRQWLNENGFPRSVLMMASLGEALGGSEPFKARVLGDVHERFTNLRYGIGDKASDIQVYFDNGMTGILLLDVAPDASPDDLWQKVRDLQLLPANTQVVSNWRQVEQVIFENKQFPADQAQRPLMELASQREGEKRLKKAPRATTQSATQAARQSASQPGRFPASSARNFRHGRHELGASQPASMPSTNPR